MAVTIHSLVYKTICDSAKFKEGMVATRAELSASKKLYAESRTDTERYGMSVDALGALHKKGAIDSETYRRSLSKLSAEFRDSQQSASTFGSSLSTLSPSLAALATPAGAAVAAIGAVTAAVTAATTGLAALGAAAIKESAGFEQTRVSFETMLGSAENATSLLKELEDFAVATPFEFKELAGATKKLVAFGIAQEDMLPTLRAIGDISAGLSIPIGELAEIYGKARVQGRLFAEDINQLTGRGIPIIQELAKQFGVTDEAVRQLVKDGDIGFENLEQAFFDLTDAGGKFGGLMDRQSQTLLGLFSSIKDNLNVTLREIGDTLVEEFDIKGLAEDALAFSGVFRDDILPELKTAVALASDFVDELLALDDAFGGPLSDLRDMLKEFQAIRIAILQIQKAYAEMRGNEILADTAQQEIERLKNFGKARERVKTDTTRPERQKQEEEEVEKELSKAGQKMAEKLREQIAKDMGGSSSPAVREALEERVKRNQAELDKLMGGGPGSERQRPMGLGRNPFLEAGLKDLAEANKPNAQQLIDDARATAEREGVDLLDPEVKAKAAAAAEKIRAAALDPAKALVDAARETAERMGAVLDDANAGKAAEIAERIRNANPLQDLVDSSRELAERMGANLDDPAAKAKAQEIVERIRAGAGTSGLDKAKEALQKNLEQQAAPEQSAAEREIVEKVKKRAKSGAATEEQLREYEQELRDDHAAKEWEKEIRDGEKMANEAVKNRKEAEKRMRGIEESGMSKEDLRRRKLFEDVAKLDEDAKTLGLSEQDRAAAEEQLRSKFDEDMKSIAGADAHKPRPSNRAFERGSAEAFSFLNKAAMGGGTNDPNKATAKNTEKTASAAERAAKALEDLNRKVGPGGRAGAKLNI